MPSRPPTQLDTVVDADAVVESVPPTKVQPVLLAGRYELLAQIGSGGGGTVYRARDVELDEIIAVKTLRDRAIEARDIAALRREVKLARRVTHKNVARTFDIGEHDGARFLTMEYVEGQPLSRIIAGPRLSIVRAARIARSIAEGIAAAHEAGVIHRDLKPANVLVENTGRVVITDFGIARLGLRREGDGPMSGAFEGTPIYMAPEQLAASDDIDGRADLYALGEILFELLTGERAWPGDSTYPTAAKRLLADPPDPRTERDDIPPALAALVVRLLARARDDRPATATEVAEALLAFTTDRTPMSRELSVAVLPFTSAAPSDEFVAEGFTDDLVATLSTTQTLRVTPRSLVWQCRRSDVDPIGAGRQLGVDVIVTGDIVRTGGGFEVVVRLFTVADGRRLWAKTFSGATTTLLLACDEVARAIGAELATAIVAPVRRAAKDPVAIEKYLRARQILARTFYGGDAAGALELLDDALRREPDEPNILAAYAIARSRITRSAADGPLAMDAAERATRLAPHLAEGWLALAIIRQQHTEFPEMIGAVMRTLRCQPHLAKAHHLLGDVMFQIGRLELAASRCDLALALDPMTRGAAITRAIIHAHAGEWDRADVVLGHPSNADPPLPWIVVHARARMAMWRNELLDPARAPEVPETRQPAAIIARLGRAVAVTRAIDPTMLAAAHAMRGFKSTLLKALVGQVEAEVHAFVGDHDRALEAIEFADESGFIDLVWLDRPALFEPLRSSPRFEAVRERVGARCRSIEELLVAEGAL